jgi:hypothetical protein
VEAPPPETEIPSPAALPVRNSPPGKGLTVLVADDETPLRQAVVEILHASGYTVFEAHTSADAVKIAEQCGKRLDILLTDILMPGLRRPGWSPNVIRKFALFTCRGMPKIFLKSKRPRTPPSSRSHFVLQRSWNSLNSCSAKPDLVRNFF